MAKGLANWVTDAGPLLSVCTTARRVGSESALKVFSMDRLLLGMCLSMQVLKVRSIPK